MCHTGTYSEYKNEILRITGIFYHLYIAMLLYVIYLPPCTEQWPKKYKYLSYRNLPLIALKKTALWICPLNGKEGITSMNN